MNNIQCTNHDKFSVFQPKSFLSKTIFLDLQKQKKKKNERVVLEKEKGEKLTRAHDSQKSFVISWKVTGFWKELFIG